MDILPFVLAVPNISVLRADMEQRKRQAFRPGTRANHLSQFKSYIMFCAQYGLQDIPASTDTICLFAEHLGQRLRSARSVRNYVSAVRLLHKYVGQTPPSLHSFELSLVLRALDLTMSPFSRQVQPVTEAMLIQISDICTSLGTLGMVLKCAFLLGFYGFLRQSNLAPPSCHSFQPTKHTCRGDVIFHPPGLCVVLKWTKTLQNPDSPSVIPIPAVPGHALCPVTAYQDMLKAVPTRHPNDPLLQIPSGTPPAQSGTRILSVRDLQQAFQAIVHCLGYTDKLTLHSLRKGGATSAYEAGVDYLHIKRHGTWRSDAFWAYITPQIDSTVPKALAKRITKRL